MNHYLEAADAYAERVVARELRRLDDRLTLGYLEVALLLASVVAVVLLAGVFIAVTT